MFLDRLLKASAPTGVFLEDDERAQLQRAGEMPIRFWSEFPFDIPVGHRDFRQTGSGTAGALTEAAYREAPAPYFEIIEDNPVPGGFKFTRVFATAFPDGHLHGESRDYCVIERREGVFRRRTVFEVWRSSYAGVYSFRPDELVTED